MTLLLLLATFLTTAAALPLPSSTTIAASTTVCAQYFAPADHGHCLGRQCGPQNFPAFQTPTHCSVVGATVTTASTSTLSATHLPTSIATVGTPTSAAAAASFPATDLVKRQSLAFDVIRGMLTTAVNGIIQGATDLENKQVVKPVGNVTAAHATLVRAGKDGPGPVVNGSGDASVVASLVPTAAENDTQLAEAVAELLSGRSLDLDGGVDEVGDVMTDVGEGVVSRPRAGEGEVVALNADEM